MNYSLQIHKVATFEICTLPSLILDGVPPTPSLFRSFCCDPPLKAQLQLLELQRPFKTHHVNSTSSTTQN